MSERILVVAQDDDGAELGIIAYCGEAEEPVGILSTTFEACIDSAVALIGPLVTRVAQATPVGVEAEVSIGFGVESGKVLAAIGSGSATAAITLRIPGRRSL